MRSSRRAFIKQIAIALTAVALSQCASFPGQGGLARVRLRLCWRGLVRLRRQARKDRERSEKTSERLKADHRAALDNLVAAGELDPAVAEHVQAVYVAAVDHAWRFTGRTCYLRSGPLPARYYHGGMLLLRIDILGEAASRGDVNPETAARAREALERDMMFFSSLGKLDAEVPPEVAEAARFLVDLLTGA